MAWSHAVGHFLVICLCGTVFASLGGEFEAIVGPTAAKGLGESLDDELARSSFSSQDKASVKEIVGKVHRKHKSQLKLGETLKAAVEAKLGTQVPITKSIQKIIDDVADELSRTCAATALSAGKGPKEKTSAADSNLTTATTNKNAKGPAGDVAQHKGGGTFDWTQCKSEGGDKNCAACSDVEGGVLPCDQVRGKTPSHDYSKCPDDKQVLKRMYWQLRSMGGDCRSLTHVAALTGTAFTTWKFPTLGNSLVLTKAFVTHPNKASRSVGIYMFKRLVTHKCTGKNPTFCKSGTTVADVYKTGVCVKCDYDVFEVKFAAQATIKHRESFVNTCLPKAINNTTGELNADFICSGSDLEAAEDSIAGF